ncbi:MAG: DUF3306 domain-containing protein [Rubrivivax sp.]
MSERSPTGGFLSRWSRVKTGRATATATATRDDPEAVVRARADVTALPSDPATKLPAVAVQPTPALARPPDAEALQPPGATATADAVEASPTPTLQDAAAVPAGGDVARFMARDVSPEVRNVALKRLFADPAFNVMDGLDTYIDDYGRPDPLPAASLRKMAAAAYLNLFDDEAEAEATPAPVALLPSTAPSSTSTPPEGPANEDPDLRLQPHDAAEPGGAEPGPEPDAGGER